MEIRPKLALDSQPSSFEGSLALAHQKKQLQLNFFLQDGVLAGILPNLITAKL